MFLIENDVICLHLIKPLKEKAPAYSYTLLLSRLERKLLLTYPEQAERLADLLDGEIIFFLQIFFFLAFICRYFLKLFCFEKHKSIDNGYFHFDGVFRHFETREGDVGGVEYGSWKVRKGGLGGKPSAISFGKIHVKS